MSQNLIHLAVFFPGYILAKVSEFALKFRLSLRAHTAALPQDPN